MSICFINTKLIVANGCGVRWCLLHPSPIFIPTLPHPQPSQNPTLFPFLALPAPHIPSISPYPFLFPPPFPSFGCPPYPFCYPPIPPNSAPPSHPSPSQPIKPSVSKPPPLPVITLPKITTKPSTSFSDHGGRKSSFRIDAKFFSFSFDGGRSDSYAIHKSCRNVKSTIWVGHKRH